MDYLDYLQYTEFLRMKYLEYLHFLDYNFCNIYNNLYLQVCVDRPVEVVRVGCEDISLDKCITVPDIVTEVETSEVSREDVFSTADQYSPLCCRCAGPSWGPPTARRRSWSCPRRAASRLCTDTPTALRRGSRLSSEHEYVNM